MPKSFDLLISDYSEKLQKLEEETLKPSDNTTLDVLFSRDRICYWLQENTPSNSEEIRELLDRD